MSKKRPYSFRIPDENLKQKFDAKINSLKREFFNEKMIEFIKIALDKSGVSDPKTR